jgi:hypothetical protein
MRQSRVNHADSGAGTHYVSAAAVLRALAMVAARRVTCAAVRSLSAVLSPYIIVLRAARRGRLLGSWLSATPPRPDADHHGES